MTPIHLLLRRRSAIAGDTALRPAHFFGTSAEFWLNLQSLYELRLAEAKTGRAIKTLPTLKRLGKAMRAFRPIQSQGRALSEAVLEDREDCC